MVGRWAKAPLGSEVDLSAWITRSLHVALVADDRITREFKNTAVVVPEAAASLLQSCYL